jgi:xanthine dehydrogenase/oxidase
MALYAYLRSNPGATAEDLEHCLDGNLCRCTGYRPILDAAKSVSKLYLALLLVISILTDTLID